MRIFLKLKKGEFVKYINLVTVLAFFAAPLSGCGLLINGTHQEIPISTNPSGATVSVGGSQYVTPATMSLTRDRSYQVVVNKPGYQQTVTNIDSSFSGWTILDTIFIVPWVADLASGAACKLTPDSIQLSLQPVEASSGSSAATQSPAQSASASVSAQAPAPSIKPMSQPISEH